MRSNCKFGAIWWVFHDFNPFSWVVFREVNLRYSLSDCNCTVIVSHSNLSALWFKSNGSWALWIRKSAESWSSTSLHFSVFIADDSFLNLLSLRNAPWSDRVIISWCDDLITVDYWETPDLPIRVRLHDCCLWAGVQVNLVNGAISASYKGTGPHDIDGSDQNSPEVDIFFFSKGRSVPNSHEAVFTAGVKFTLGPPHSAYEARSVGFEGRSQGVAVPDVNAGVGTTWVKNSLVIISTASKTCHFSVASKDTSVIFKCFIPEFYVLSTNSSECVVTWFGRELNIEDSVSVSNLRCACAWCHIE